MKMDKLTDTTDKDNSNQQSAATIVSSLATATPITSEIVSESFDPNPKFEITTLEKASYEDIYLEATNSSDLPQQQQQQQQQELQQEEQHQSAIGTSPSVDKSQTVEGSERTSSAFISSQASVDAQMEKVIDNIVELGGVHQFSQTLGQDREKVLESIHREITSDRSSIDLIADVASKQQSIEIGSTGTKYGQQQDVLEDKSEKGDLASSSITPEQIAIDLNKIRETTPEQLCHEDTNDKVTEAPADVSAMLIEPENSHADEIVTETIELSGAELHEGHVSGEIITGKQNQEEQDVLEEQVQEEHIQEEPVHEEQIQEETHEVQALEKPVHDEQVQEEPIQEEHDKQKPVHVEQAMEELVHDEKTQVIPVQEGQAAEEPVHNEQVQEEPVQEEQATEELIREEPAKEEPVQEEQAEEEPVLEEPAKEEPVQEEQAKEEPVQEEQAQVQEQAHGEQVQERPMQVEPVQEEPVQEKTSKREPKHEKRAPPETKPAEPVGRTSRTLRTRAPKRLHEDEESPKFEPPKKQAKRSRGTSDVHSKTYGATKNTPTIKLPASKSRLTISTSNPATGIGAHYKPTKDRTGDTDKKYVCLECGYATDRIDNQVLHSKHYCEVKFKIGEVMKADITRQQQQAKGKRRQLR